MRRLFTCFFLVVLLGTYSSNPLDQGYLVAHNLTSKNLKSLPRSTPERQGISAADILDFVDTADKQIDTMNSHAGVMICSRSWWDLTMRDATFYIR